MIDHIDWSQLRWMVFHVLYRLIFAATLIQSLESCRSSTSGFYGLLCQLLLFLWEAAPYPSFSGFLIFCSSSLFDCFSPDWLSWGDFFLPRDFILRCFSYLFTWILNSLLVAWLTILASVSCLPRKEKSSFSIAKPASLCLRCHSETNLCGRIR